MKVLLVNINWNMFQIIIIIISQIISITIAISPIPCITNASQIVYSSDGFASFVGTFSACLANVPDALLPPNFYGGTYNGIIRVNNSLQINNLHQVDDIGLNK